LNIAEGLPYHLEISQKITGNKNIFLKENADPEMIKALACIQPQDFQAIIPLPFFYYGSESYSRPLQDQSVKNSLLFSAYTGLPQFSAYLTRTSIRESKNIVQLMSPPWYNKEIEDDIIDDRDFLILCTAVPLSMREEMILERASEIYKSENFSLYRLKKEELFSNNARAIITDFTLKSHSFHKSGDFFLRDSLQWYYYTSFESWESDTCFRGEGAYSGKKTGKNTFAEFPPNTFDVGKEYTLSAWMYNNAKDALNLWFRFMVEEYDEAGDTWHITTSFPESSETIYGDWSLVELNFTIQDSNSRIYIVSKGKDNSTAPLYLDDLLIRKAGEDIYSIESDNKTITLFMNNHEIITRLE
jgi:hypothetical protein